jgi:hypothetical protein
MFVVNIIQFAVRHEIMCTKHRLLITFRDIALPNLAAGYTSIKRVVVVMRHNLVSFEFWRVDTLKMEEFYRNM